MLELVDQSGTCLMLDADYTTTEKPIKIFPNNHEQVAYNQAKEFNSLILNKYNGQAPKLFSIKQVLLGGATIVKNKQAVNPLLSWFKRQPMRHNFHTGRSANSEVSANTEAEKTAKTWAQTATTGSVSQGTALTLDSMQNTEERTKRLEDKLMALLNMQQFNENAMKRLDVTMTKLLSLQEMACFLRQHQQSRL